MNRENQSNDDNSIISQLWSAILWISLVIILTGLVPGLVAAPLSAAASQTAVTLSWTAPGDDGVNGTASGYSIRYSLVSISLSNWSSAAEASSLPTPQTAGSSENFEVTGLEPGTLYYLAIRSVDEAGNWSGLSNVVSISTDVETDPPMVVADLQVTSASSSSLTMGWTAPGDDSAVGTASQYELRYSTSAINSGNFSAATLVIGMSNPLSAGSSESFEVTGLNSSTTYYFALITSDEIPNWSTISNLASGATTLETIAPSVIADLTAQNAAETAIELAWTAPGDDGGTGLATEYEIRYSLSVINDANWSSATPVASQPTPAVAGTAETYLVTGLSSATIYYFAIKTADEVPNWSGLSNLVSLSTGADQTPPAAIGDLTVASSGP